MDKDNSEGNIIDFKHHLVKDLNKKHDALVDYCRDNLSTQAQVHKAVLKLIHAKNLEQLLETLAIDLPAIFAVDVVRLVMESDIPVETAYGEPHYSGVVFADSGTAESLFGSKNTQKNVVLADDTETKKPTGFAQIFADCEDLIKSCALMRLPLETVERNITLALGTRQKGHFHTGQGTEIFHFLAQVVAVQLDKYLDDLPL